MNYVDSFFTNDLEQIKNNTNEFVKLVFDAIKENRLADVLDIAQQVSDNHERLSNYLNLDKDQEAQRLYYLGQITALSSFLTENDLKGLKRDSKSMSR